MKNQLTAAAPLAALQLDNYRIHGQIGEGGYGFVFEAEQISTGQKVAIKLLKLSDELDDQKRKYQIARFERETMLCAELNHPNIVTAYDAGNCDGLRLRICRRNCCCRLAQVSVSPRAWQL